MDELFSLKGKVSIVTGALGLLGKEHCKALSRAGANVIVCDLDKEKSYDFARTLSENSISGKPIGIFLDVTDPDSINDAKEIILNEFGHIDVLVNNAAINDMFEDPKVSKELSNFENYPLHAWKRSIDVNLTGVFLCSQIFGSQMASQLSGSIINIASTYGIVAPDQSIYKNDMGEQEFIKPPVYSATKGAVIAFSKYLASYWGNKGVRVNTLSPGGVLNKQKEYFVRNYSRRTQLGRMAAPTDYAGAIVFLASDASSYMTGANLVVDGGYIAW
jgi:NAD(P)-dependent dehydrogenase (short-subunit alcohol dehydrogenase family)